MKVTKAMIKDGLTALGLKAGDKILVHSALSSMGKVEGGAVTLIQALKETVGPAGLLAMTRLGNAQMAKVFSLQKGVVESFHPTHPVAAWGAKADELIRDHIRSPTACGKETPFGRMIDWGGYILLIGVDQDRNTILHTVEEYADAPYLSDYTTTYIDKRGRKHTITFKKYPGPHRDFIGLDRLFREQEVMRVGKIGNADCRLMKMPLTVETGVHALKRDPAAVLCRNPNCADCVMQRGKIKAARLRRESFSLSAFTDSLEGSFDDRLKTFQGQGIDGVELGSVGQWNVVDCPDGALQEIRRKLMLRQFRVSALNTGVNDMHIGGDLKANFDRFRATLNLARSFKCDRVIVSSFAFPGSDRTAYRKAVLDQLSRMASLARKQKVLLLLENKVGTYCASSRDCLDVLESVDSPALRLAFNPAEFARNGEKPFLGIAPHIRKMAAQLYINDALFCGAYVLPGHGNAEIKELISILRCRNFNGCLTFKPRLVGGRDEFVATADAFWHLLDTM